MKPLPSALAETAATDDEALSHYCPIRNQIRAFVEKLPEWLQP